MFLKIFDIQRCDFLHISSFTHTIVIVELLVGPLALVLAPFDLRPNSLEEVAALLLFVFYLRLFDRRVLRLNFHIS